MNNPLLAFTERGIYCEKADVYLDPWKPVDKAIITHGHADHSRPGSQRYITHHHNIPIIKHRLGSIRVSGKQWGETFRINGVEFCLFPAGHIVGSSQVKVSYKGEDWVFTGDYKVRPDGLATPYEVVPCHTMITECTFGLPAFNWLPQPLVMDEINSWCAQNNKEGITSVLFAYTLGKAQRLLKHLDPNIARIYTHAAIENMNEVVRAVVDLPETTRITGDTKKEEVKGAIILAPPSAHGSPWIRRWVPYATASASGWMTFRGARRRRAIDKGFVLSDHADWKGLIDAIKSSGATKVICTHGYSEIFSRYLCEIGLDARTESTQFEAENAELDSTAENSQAQ